MVNMSTKRARSVTHHCLVPLNFMLYFSVCETEEIWKAGGGAKIFYGVVLAFDTEGVIVVIQSSCFTLGAV